MSILVSIACTTYNHEKYIADAIESFLMQKTTFDFEILIGEDCSTDNTRKIVEEYLNIDKVRLVTSKENVGMQKNYQRLQDSAKGNYLAICEGDDYWLSPYKLQKQIDYMEENPNCTMCFHGAEVVKADRKTTGKVIKPYAENLRLSAGDIALTQFPTASVVYRKSILDNTPQWVTEALAGDYPTALFASSHGYAYYIDEIMSAYRTAVNGSATTRLYTSGNSKIINFHKSVINMLENFNKYSNCKYSEQVNKAKIAREIDILLLERNFSKIKNQRYKEYFEEMRLMNKIKFYARLFMPNVYAKLVAIKNNDKLAL